MNKMFYLVSFYILTEHMVRKELQHKADFICNLFGEVPFSSRKWFINFVRKYWLLSWATGLFYFFIEV